MQRAEDRSGPLPVILRRTPTKKGTPVQHGGSKFKPEEIQETRSPKPSNKTQTRRGDRTLRRDSEPNSWPPHRCRSNINTCACRVIVFARKFHARVN